MTHSNRVVRPGTLTARPPVDVAARTPQTSDDGSRNDNNYIPKRFSRQRFQSARFERRAKMFENSHSRGGLETELLHYGRGSRTRSSCAWTPTARRSDPTSSLAKQIRLRRNRQRWRVPWPGLRRASRNPFGRPRPACLGTDPESRESEDMQCRLSTSMA